jgi:hypothetical protein
MAYSACLDRLLQILHTRAPAKVEALNGEKRRVAHGLLSVGLKLHCLGEEDLFAPLIAALGGQWILNRNVYRKERAKFCLVLPPVGSAKAAVLLLECIECYTGCRVFNNPNIQLQVCSPGRLNPRNAALHAIGFYLSSDTLRQYALEDFATTVSTEYYHRGKHLVIYDAGLLGDFDAAFAWWARSADGLFIRPSLPFLDARTDLLLGPGSSLDIHNINILATLLVHAQSNGDGYWGALGELFADELISLLDRHLLAGLLEAPWVCIPTMEGTTAPGQLFASALQELTSYAAAEAARLTQLRERTFACGGILAEVQELLATYRAIVTSISEPEQGGPHAYRSPTGLGTH